MEHSECQAALDHIAIIAHCHHVLAPSQALSMARCARWVRVWGWSRKKLGIDVTAGQVRVRAALRSRGLHVADSESTTFTQAIERETGVGYKTAQRWVRWGALGAKRLRQLEHTPQDDQRHLDALCVALKPRPSLSLATPAIAGPWRKVQDRVVSCDGSIELRLGDSRQLLGDFEPESVDAVISDQPFGVAYADTDDVTIAGDEHPEPIASWSAPAMWRVLRQDRFCVLHGVFKRLARDGRYVDTVWREHMDAAGLPMVDIAMWNKGSPGQGGYLMHQHEQVWIHAKGSPLAWHKGDADVWSFPRPTDTDHPTPKPVELHERQMIIFSPPGGLVLDPFCGRGATARAALRTGRRYIGIELSERWYSEAVDRLNAEQEARAQLAA